MSAPPTFTLFLNLPTELQIKIWGFALPGPRIIQCHHSKGSVAFHGARPLAALHVCKLSREAALSVYEPAFRNSQQTPLYINLAHDTFYLVTNFKMCEYTTGIYPKIKEKVRCLVVEISSEEDLEMLVVDIVRLDLKNPREIILVIEHEEKLLEFKYAGRDRFSEPELSHWRFTAGTVEPILWRSWKSVIENMRQFKGCRVQVA